MRQPGVASLAVFGAAAAISACGGGDGVTAPIVCRGPEVASAAITASPGNVLAAVVTARLVDADSVAVHFRAAGAAADSLTPVTIVTGDSVAVPVLGLLSEMEYQASLVAYGECDLVTESALTLTTGALPEDLPTYTTEGSDPSPGFVVFAAGAYGLVIDNTGRVVWYHRFDEGPGLNFQPQPNGRYVARPPAPDPLEPWVELDVLGRVTRRPGCVNGLVPRFHDLIIEGDGSYWVMCDETRDMDLAAIGGPSNARVAGTGVQHRSADGDVLFTWSPFDHLTVESYEQPVPGQPSVNWTHGNAIALDAEGNLLISFRNLSEITKIDTRTGSIRWRLGGMHNEFTFEGPLSPPFARQHGLRLAEGGELVLLDNLGDPTGSRTLRYAIDETTRTARLDAVYRPDAQVIAQVGGTTQPLPGGRTLVSYGSGGRVEEYDSAGRVVWRIAGNPGYVFRAQRIRSLYAPGADAPQ